MDFQDLSLHYKLPSMMTVIGGTDVSLDGGASFFDGSRFNPIEEAASVLGTSLESEELVCEGDLQLGVHDWLHSSIENDSKDSLITSYDSCYDKSICEDSSVFESSWASQSTHDDSSSQFSDFDRSGSISMLGHRVEDFECLSDREHDFDAFQLCSMRPSFHLKRNFGMNSLNEKPIANPSSEAVMESETHSICSTCKDDQEGPDSDEPLFWPFERDSYWHSQVESGPCLSPIKTNINVSSYDKFCGQRSIKLGFPKRKAEAKPRRDVPSHAKKGACISGSSMPIILGSNKRDGNKSFKETRTNASRLNSGIKASSERHSSNFLKSNKNSSVIHCEKEQTFHSRYQLHCHDGREFKREMNKNIEGITNITVSIKHNDLKQMNPPQTDIPCGDFDNFLREASKANEEVSIEKLVGLNEFSGNEGVDAEFGEGKFSIDELVVEDP